jgi:hypothetical protein
MIIGTVAFLAFGRKSVVFYTTFICVGTLLYAIYFPMVFCKLNNLGRMPAILFIICSLPLAGGRSFLAERIVMANAGPMEVPPLMAPPVMR